MLKRLCLSTIIGLFFFISACSDEKIHIVHVSDVHGHLYPFNYVSNVSTTNSLASVYTFVDSMRSEGENVLLIDTGDLLQGSPMLYYYCDVDTTITNPAAAIYNYMGLSALIMGNHDIEKGPDIYRKFERELEAPLLSANAILDDGNSAFDPYVILEDGGIKVGLIGLTTPAIPLWLPESKYPGITWTDISSAADKHVAGLEAQVDYLVAGVHAGIDSVYAVEATEREGLPRENDALKLGMNFPELDLILCGHEHRIIPGEYYQNTGKIAAISMPGSWARYFNHIVLEKDKAPLIEVKQSRWYNPHPGVLALMQSYHEKTLQYVNEPISRIDTDLSLQTAYFYDNALIDYIQEVQLEYTGADVSFAACFNPRGKIKKGDVTVKEIFALYVFENYLYGVMMSGKQIKDYLEESAKFLQSSNSDQLINNKIPGYNFDMAAGLTYTIDLANDPGNRIKILKIAGKRYKPQERYKVALNSYRASGGGGHLSAVGIITPETYFKSSKEIRNLLIKALIDGKKINEKPDNNWKIIGDRNFDEKVEKWVTERF